MAIAAGTVSRDQWIEAMEPTLRELFTFGLKEYDVWKSCVIEKKSEKRREELLEFRKPDVVQETPEGAPYNQLTTDRTRSASVVNLDYTGSIRITHQMIRDTQYDEMMEQSWGLGESIARKLYEDAVAQFYNGFASNLSPDGVAWFSASHPLSASASLGDNLLSAQALSPDALNAAWVKLQKTLNENGKPIPMGNGKLQLIVPPELYRLAKQLEMKGEYEPGSAEHDVNVFNIEAVCLPLLSMAPSNASTMWFLRDPRMAKNLFFLREGPIFDKFIDPYTDDVIVKVRISYSFLVASWRATIGCVGA